jgi:hypothetical protein
MAGRPYPLKLKPGDKVTIRAQVVAVQETALDYRMVTIHIPGPGSTVTSVTLWESQVEPVLTEPAGPVEV